MSDIGKMASEHYVQERRAEWDALERWENEGGRPRRYFDKSVDSVAENPPLSAIFFVGFNERKHVAGPSA